MVLDFRASQLRGAKLIASGSTGTGATLLFYPIAAEGTPANQGNISATKFVTGSIGTDIFLFVSGGIDQKGTAASNAITAFGGDVHISGSLTTVKMSGSLQKLLDGSSYLRAGGSVTIVSQANGSIAISGSIDTQWTESSTVPRIRTTASVYIGTGAFFAEEVASSSVFYVSGASGGAFVGVDRHIVLPDTSMSGNILFIKTSTNQIPRILGSGGNPSVQFSGSNLSLVNTAAAGQISVGKSTAISGGVDIFFNVSGSINGSASDTNKALLPDTNISGNLWFKSSSLNPVNTIYNGNRNGGIQFSGSFIQTLTPTMFAFTFNLLNSQPNNSDVFLFVSGTRDGTFTKVALLPDTMISGTLRIDAEANSPASLVFQSGSAGIAFGISKDPGVAWNIENQDAATPTMNISLPAGTTGGSAANIGFYGRAVFTMGLSGTLHKLETGNSYLSGNQIRVVTQSTGQVVLSGGYVAITSYSVDFTLSEQDQFLHLSTTGSAVNITLPTPAPARQWLISKTTGSNKITILSGSYAINGVTASLDLPGSTVDPVQNDPQSWLLYSDTVSWFLR